ncbi:hypothetical protein SKAU_G00067330 [Synaphobranchus kaupii]|uniref:Uncharacterized protein n=1 Tax=Synaphobranchus kaupii TaxID=118154 RepID=A0A9Q1G6Y8_SYNKA|nr:hypothetical protein SKAU_G00067330 [Synaphobranchus kaupii]
MGSRCAAEGASRVHVIRGWKEPPVRGDAVSADGGPRPALEAAHIWKHSGSAGPGHERNRLPFHVNEETQDKWA